mgnify:FL=1
MPKFKITTKSDYIKTEVWEINAKDKDEAEYIVDSQNANSKYLRSPYNLDQTTDDLSYEGLISSRTEDITDIFND